MSAAVPPRTSPTRRGRRPVPRSRPSASAPWRSSPRTPTQPALGVTRSSRCASRWPRCSSGPSSAPRRGAPPLALRGASLAARPSALGAVGYAAAGRALLRGAHAHGRLDDLAAALHATPRSSSSPRCALRPRARRPRGASARSALATRRRRRSCCSAAARAPSTPLGVVDGARLRPSPTRPTSWSPTTWSAKLDPFLLAALVATGAAVTFAGRRRRRRRRCDLERSAPRGVARRRRPGRASRPSCRVGTFFARPARASGPATASIVSCAEPVVTVAPGHGPLRRAARRPCSSRAARSCSAPSSCSSAGVRCSGDGAPALTAAPAPARALARERCLTATAGPTSPSGTASARSRSSTATRSSCSRATASR